LKILLIIFGNKNMTLENHPSYLLIGWDANDAHVWGGLFG